MAMGGNTGSNVLSSADTVNPQGGCNVELPPLPFPSNYGLGMAYSDGAPMVCGGSGAGDGRRCLVHSLSQVNSICFGCNMYQVIVQIRL